VDGLTDAGDITQLFAARYRNLYTSIPYNMMKSRLFLMVSTAHYSWHVYFEGLYFINGGRDCLSIVAFLLTAITVHGTVPEFQKIYDST